MINKTENKNAFAVPTVRLKFPDSRAALVVGQSVRNPAIKNLKHGFFENFRVKNPLTNRILSSLNANDFSRLQPHLQPVTLTAGESLYQPHDIIRYVYFLESAVVSDLQMLEDGRTIEVAMVGKEGVTGFSSVFNSQPSLNWTEVTLAGNAFKLNAQILRQEFSAGGMLQTSLLDYINSYIGQISQKVICNNYHQMKGRFCSWLLMIQKGSGKDKFSLTHEHISRLLGVHRPGISNLAKELREREVIDYQRGEIFLLNHQILRSLACPCFHSV